MRMLLPPHCSLVFDFPLLNSLTSGPDSKKLIRTLPNVVEYARRIHGEYFAEYAAPVWE